MRVADRVNEGPPATRRAWIMGLALTGTILLAYLPVWRAGFIWDDDSHLTENVCVVGPVGFPGIWTSSAAVYYPLVLTTFWAEHRLWGLNPRCFHVFNVLVHAACALLLWRTLRALRVPGAWLGAALWGLHPVMVQSAAWVTELKNTQSCLFYLWSALVYVGGFRPGENARPGWRRVGLALLLFGLAITSKASTVMLPVVLALCAWWLEGRWRWRNLGWLAPFFLVAALASGWTIWEQKYHSGALGQEWVHPWPERVVIAGRDVWFYLGKLAWPHPLVFIYPRWDIDARVPLAYLPAVAAVAGLAALWWCRDGRARPFLFAGAYFVVSLFPVLNFFSVFFFRFSFVSDHFQYLASIGPLALAGAGLATAAARPSVAKRPWLAPGVCAALLCALAALTWRQCAIYADGQTLYRSILARNPACWLAHNNLGNLLFKQGRIDEAASHYRAALRAKPDDYTEAHNNLGRVAFQQGNVDAAIAEYHLSLAADPRSSEACYNLANALLQKGEVEAAVARFREALRLKPDYAEAHNNLGNALLRQGRLDEAGFHYTLALRVNPNYAEAHHNLAGGYLQTKNYRQAIFHYGRALEIQPNFADAANSLAWILATCPDPTLRDGTRAVALAEHANELRGRGDLIVLGTLAAAYGEAGRFPDAIRAASQALALTEGAGNAALVQTLETHVALYRRGRPVRDGATGGD